MSAQPLPASERFVYVRVDDPLARPLFDELATEYATRYADLSRPEDTRNELERYPAQAFEPPHGAFVLLLRDGEPVAGGAFMRHADPGTVEFKRIWTRHDLRRQGLARRVLDELEAQALRQGYARVVLGTGSRQPEAVALYESAGYTLVARRHYAEGHPPGYAFAKALSTADP
ncbi:MAG: GNAT family N-acetyltransferase [Pseudoxanthomonas sp.]